jgi:hypothetical protein
MTFGKKRGITKPFSPGKLGEEQKRDRAREASAKWHKANDSA